MKMKIMLFALMIIPSRVQCLEKYELFCQQRLLEVSYKIMMNQVGTVEKGRNSGPGINKYQESAGIGDGQPYCAAGQYYCFMAAACELHLDQKEIPIRRTGLANSMYDNAKFKGRRGRSGTVLHDLVVWRKINSKSGHIERVINSGRCGWVTTVGFNTSRFDPKTNLRIEGVFIHRRNLLQPLSRMPLRGIIGFYNKR
jgi:hypothetical protein